MSDLFFQLCSQIIKFLESGVVVGGNLRQRSQTFRLFVFLLFILVSNIPTSRFRSAVVAVSGNIKR